ncbi:MAG TPA: RidA family protein [Chloroflexota bacterium]|nr:RidA family protein [Chloroflexota bacterium]
MADRRSIFLSREGPRRQEAGSAPIPEGSRIGNVVASSLLHGINWDVRDMSRTDPEEQAREVFRAVEQFMANAGGTTENIVQLTVYLKDEQYRKAINAEWLKMFPNPESRPGRIVVYRDFPNSNLFFEVSVLAVL